MTDADRAALEMAMELIGSESPGRAEQIDWKLRDDGQPWDEVARFAASCLQAKALHLKPWQTPPVSMDEDGNVGGEDREAQALLRRMLAAGISRFHPRPLDALAEANRHKG